MYHKISPSISEGLTIASEILDTQLRWLKDQNYQTHHLSQVADLVTFSSKRNIVLTFDDAYVSQLEYAYPLLKKHGMKATFFVPLKYLGSEDSWNDITAPIMTAAQLHSLDPSIIELAYHSYSHQKYDELSIENISEDTTLAFQTVQENKLPLKPFLAYPYGKFPRKNPKKERFFTHLEEESFLLGLRIGNRLNSFPFQNKFEIQRIDVRGEWSLKKFIRKTRFGKMFWVVILSCWLVVDGREKFPNFRLSILSSINIEL